MTAVSQGCRVAISTGGAAASRSRSNGSAPGEPAGCPTAKIAPISAVSAPLTASASTPAQVMRTSAPLSSRW